ncbi:amino acid transporter AVT1I [Beta vulgaris subsp. vulgaris]|uniref:amino acid transporter AVT1I n=1 Tax=Beta vulgaris subsp. vulgaris TaxID=3555 RepID=UPI002037233C|nr:amino acid transporter AVT1I [Beta vulgaris subsp. vulgaris]
MELQANNNQLSLIEGNTSLFKTVFNGANTILGNGVLLVPYALASGGWLSLALLFTISILVTYTGLLIKRCMEVDPRIKSYPDIGEHAFGKTGKTIASIILYVELYMGTTGFLILEGDNLHKLFPKVAINILGISLNGKSSFIIIIALILLPTVLLDNLSIFAYISATGCLAALLVLGSILWVAAFNGVGFHQAQNASFLINWKGLPTAISLYMLCYTSHPVFPTLYTSMQKKHHFFKAMLFSFVFATFVYASMAILGYLMFGSQVESQITLNLTTERVASKIAIYTTVITPLVKYALLLKPVVITTESWLSSKYMENMFIKVVIKLFLVVTQVFVALAFPFFGYLMALVGALLGAPSSLTIPCLCYLKTSNNQPNQGVLERVFIWGIVCSSILILVSGTYTSVVNIVEEFTDK